LGVHSRNARKCYHHPLISAGDPVRAEGQRFKLPAGMGVCEGMCRIAASHNPFDRPELRQGTQHFEGEFVGSRGFSNQTAFLPSLRFATALLLLFAMAAIFSGCSSPAPVKAVEVPADNDSMIKAVRDAQPEAVESILRRDPTLANAVDSSGRTALFYACFPNLTNMAQVLHRAKLVQLLLQSGADVNAVNKEGSTALHAIPYYDMMPTIGQTIVVNGKALFDFVEDSQIQSLRLLLARHATVDATDPNGYTPLHFAASKGHAKLVAILLQNGADRTRETRSGDTPLKLAQDELREWEALKEKKGAGLDPRQVKALNLLFGQFRDTIELLQRNEASAPVRN